MSLQICQNLFLINLFDCVCFAYHVTHSNAGATERCSMLLLLLRMLIIPQKLTYMHGITHCPKKKMNEKYRASSNSTSQGPQGCQKKHHHPLNLWRLSLIWRKFEKPSEMIFDTPGTPGGVSIVIWIKIVSKQAVCSWSKEMYVSQISNTRSSMMRSLH